MIKCQKVCQEDRPCCLTPSEEDARKKRTVSRRGSRASLVGSEMCIRDSIRRRRQEKADSQQAWLARWQSLVPEENRNVPVTVERQTRIAYIQINQFVVMLQDGLLMKAHFFDVCEFFQKAGYHVVWLMRCVQDVEGGYL